MVSAWLILSMLGCGFTPAPDLGDTDDTDTDASLDDTGPDAVDDTPDDTTDTPDGNDTPTQRESVVWDTGLLRDTYNPTPPQDLDTDPVPVGTDPRDGVWTGTMRFRAVPPTISLASESTCTGSMALTLSESNSPQVALSGTTTCTWSGTPLLAIHAQNGWSRVTITLSGQYNQQDDKVSGDIQLTDNSGQFSETTRFIGTITNNELRFVFDNVNVLNGGVRANFLIYRVALP
jgi:hypothetical protein